MKNDLWLTRSWFMWCNGFQLLVLTLNKCTSPFLFVFLPPMSKISFDEIASALQAQRVFFILTLSIYHKFFSTS